MNTSNKLFIYIFNSVIISCTEMRLVLISLFHASREIETSEAEALD